MCCNVWLTSLFTVSRSDWLILFQLEWVFFAAWCVSCIYFSSEWSHFEWKVWKTQLWINTPNGSYQLKQQWITKRLWNIFPRLFFSCKQKLVPKPSAMTYPRIVSYRLKSHLQSLCTPALKTCLNSNDCTSPLYLRTDFLADLNWWQADAKIGSTRV